MEWYQKHGFQDLVPLHPLHSIPTIIMSRYQAVSEEVVKDTQIVKDTSHPNH
jgi:hypothetical protein